MEHIAISAQGRAATITKGERKRLRRAGHIPAAVFGKGIDPTLITVEAKDVVRVMTSAAGVNTLIDLDLGGKRHLVKLAEVEIDPLSRMFLHVGLHKIQASEPQKASVPIELVGQPEPVRLGQGMLEQGTLTLEVRALPDKLVASIPVDVSAMRIGDALHASDIAIPMGLELLSPPDTSIVSLHIAKQPAVETEIEHEEAIGSTADSSAPEEALAGV